MEIKTQGFYGLTEKDKQQIKTVESNINYYNNSNTEDNQLSAVLVVDGGNKIQIYRNKRVIGFALEISQAVAFMHGLLVEFNYRTGER
jgi:hypothetical protein